MVKVSKYVGLLAVIFIVSAVGCSTGTPRPPETGKLPIKVGMLKPNLVTVIHHFAVKSEAYEKNGLAVEERPFPSGQSQAGIEALIRGELDVYMGAGAEVARFNSQAVTAGQKPPLGVVQGGTAGVTTLVLRRDVQAKTIDELKGKSLRIAVSSPSSIHLALFRYFLLERGLRTEDLGWQFVSTEAGNMVPALVSGQIEGFLHSEPTTTLAVVNNAGWVFLNARRGDMGEKARIVPVTFISTNRDWAGRNPETLRRFLKAIDEASKAYTEMPKDQAVALMAEWAGQESNIIAVAYDRLDPRMVMDYQAAQAWWETIGAAMRARGEVDAKLKFEDVFMVDLLKR
jgi:ABC-type nitrate/sulfonate/bicarbonate transport system substrate-binding protein